jgi:hypothetical protein
MVTQVVVKANVLKDTENFFLFKSVVHASMKKAHYGVTYTRTLVKYLVQVALVQVVAVNM